MKMEKELAMENANGLIINGMKGILRMDIDMAMVSLSDNISNMKANGNLIWDMGEVTWFAKRQEIFLLGLGLQMYNKVFSL